MQEIVIVEVEEVDTVPLEGRAGEQVIRDGDHLHPRRLTTGRRSSLMVRPCLLHRRIRMSLVDWRAFDLLMLKATI